jgi:hypothetical protein
MSLSLYTNTSPFPVSVGTHDFSGQRTSLVSFAPGTVFTGDTTDSAVINLLASGQIIVTPGQTAANLTLVSGIKAGLSANEFVAAMSTAL